MICITILRSGLLRAGRDKRALLLPFYRGLLFDGFRNIERRPFIAGEGGAVIYIGAGTRLLSLATSFLCIFHYVAPKVRVACLRFGCLCN